MAVLKQIKFGSITTPIAMTQVAIDSQSSTVLGVTPSDTGLDVNKDPVYTISLAVDGKTIAKGDNGLETSLALKVEAASGEGSSAKKARIALVGSDNSELSSVNIEDIVGGGIVKSAAYDPATGKLTITWAGEGDGKTTEIDLGALLDIQDIIIKSDSTNYLSFDPVTDPSGDVGQAQIGVKLADVTYTPTDKTGDTPVAAKLEVNTTNGNMLDASDAIPAIRGYVNDVLANASANLEVKAEGDDYVAASVDAKDNKKVIVATNKKDLTATAGTPGVYAADGEETTAPVAGTLSGTANSLADGADIAEKVKTYVDGAIDIEKARSDAKNKADIAALDFTDTAVTGQYVSKVDETDGVVSVERVNVSAAPLNEYAKSATAPASTAIAATDTINQAINKLEWALSNITVRYNVDGTTLVVDGVTLDDTLKV